MIKLRKHIVHRLPITKARVNLGQVVKRVHINKEYFILEKDGIPVAGILAPTSWKTILSHKIPKCAAPSGKATPTFSPAGPGPPGTF